MAKTENRQQKELRETETTLRPPVLRAEEMFQGQREIYIEHNGERYRLRITRRNKLILQK